MPDLDRHNKSRLNNVIKFVVLNINILFFLFGLLFVALACYLWFANWGNLDPGFFLGSGLIAALFGISVIMISCLASQGIKYQTFKQPLTDDQLNKLPNDVRYNNLKPVHGFWTGRKIVFLYLMLLIGILVGLVWLLSYSLTAVQNFQSNYDILLADPDANPPYANLEGQIAEKFNTFFFGAASSCSASLYLWFWNWVNNNCPSDMNQSHCQGCYDYSITTCTANENLCYQYSSGDGTYCPYSKCRADILGYMQKRIKPFSYVVLSLCCFQLVLILFTLMIFCFHPRDDSSKMIEKAGTITAPVRVKV
jgi:hypothetical protein